jgi:UDP:flavonoid glycosyltransferase YjiC (YdhE family)
LVLNEVLPDPTYRENARKLQKASAEANGLPVAADLIVKALGVKKKVSAASS